MIISAFRSDSIADLEKFLRQTEPVRFSAGDPSKDRAFLLDEIVGILADSSTSAFAARQGSEITGFISCVDSRWDTGVVGRKVAIIKHLLLGDQAASAADELIHECLQDAAAHRVKCVSCKLNSDQFPAMHALERNGFLLMDTLLDFSFDFQRLPLDRITPPRRDSALLTRSSRPEDLPQVLTLCERAFTNFVGRYHVDEMMPAGTGAAVYRQWVQSSFAGWADFIMVATMGDDLVGFGIWKMPSALEAKHSFRVAHYSLAGVDPNCAGMGIYSALAFDGMKRVEGSVDYIEGPVHVTNFAVHRALQRLGWKISGARNTFHKWIG